MNRLKKIKTLVGRSEIVSFPLLGIEAINAKIDTGAYSTAIHAPKIWVENSESGEVLYFQLLDKNFEQGHRICKTTSFYQKKVRSSNGRLEKRYIIKTPIIIGGKKRVTHLSLTNRGKMRFPVLVGRRVLRKGFIVDVSEKNLHPVKSNK